MERSHSFDRAIGKNENRTKKYRMQIEQTKEVERTKKEEKSSSEEKKEGDKEPESERNR